MTERIYIGKCPIDCITMSGTVERLQSAIANNGSLLVAPANAATVVDATRFSSFWSVLKKIDIILPDGYWLKVAARILSYPSTNHVATVPLTYNVLQELGKLGESAYLLGATDITVRAAAEEIILRFPGVNIAGVHNGYFSEPEELEIISEINNTGSQLLLIGISSPKRELFMVRNREKIDVSVIIGVGGLFDILGGKTAEGPMWLRNYGLMWLYRFAKEPKRLWKRYTIKNFQFLWIVFKQALSISFSRRQISSTKNCND